MTGGVSSSLTEREIKECIIQKKTVYMAVVETECR